MVTLTTQKRLIYLLLLAVTSFPYLVPFSLPMMVNKPTLDLYNTIESTPDGSIVCIPFDMVAQHMPEIFPQALGFLKQAVRKHFKFVMASFLRADSLIFAKLALDQTDLSKYKYGTDYVMLGYFPGAETSVVAFGKDIPGIVKTDMYGTPIESLPLMQGLRNAKDFALWILIEWNSEIFAKQIATPYGSILVTGADALDYAPNFIYYKSGQFKGILNGIRGAAEYELLLGYAGRATMGMNVQSVSHLLIMGGVIASNAFFYGKKLRRPSK